MSETVCIAGLLQEVSDAIGSMGASEQSNQTPDPSPSRDAQYIASLDVGTTTLRCFIYNSQARLCGRAEEKASGFLFSYMVQLLI